jgi:DNA polymerase III delta prime subunit
MSQNKFTSITENPSTFTSSSEFNHTLPIPTSIQNKLNYFIETNEIPHIIFHGSSGTGKKTIVYDFIDRIYKNNKQKIKSNVMIVNCAHGKGIKFIREELKFFAKKNIQANSGVIFKTIVLIDADFLTIDAQSALRRCIELFSYNTRFFIVVENKYKLLNPILSRFCEIYIPELIQYNKILNLHQYNLDRKINLEEFNSEKNQYVKDQLDSIYTTNKESLNASPHIQYVNLANTFYENGISCLDVMKYIEYSPLWKESDKINYMVHFHKIKSEYRCEKLLILCMLDYIQFPTNTYNIYA